MSHQVLILCSFFPEAALDGWEEEWDPFGAGEDPKAGDSAAAADATADVLQRQLHVSPSAGVSHQPVQQPSGGSISPVAFQCAADLLEACLASVSQPQLEDIVKVGSLRITPSEKRLT